MAGVFVTKHARKRLVQARQMGITIEDVIKEVRKIPGNIPIATRFRGFISTNGQMYDIVLKDIPKGRLIITIIGKK